MRTLLPLLFSLQRAGGEPDLKAQRVEVRLEPSFPQWPDHRPLPYGAQQQAEGK